MRQCLFLPARVTPRRTPRKKPRLCSVDSPCRRSRQIWHNPLKLPMPRVINGWLLENELGLEFSVQAQQWNMRHDQLKMRWSWSEFIPEKEKWQKATFLRWRPKTWRQPPRTFYRLKKATSEMRKRPNLLTGDEPRRFLQDFVEKFPRKAPLRAWKWAKASVMPVLQFWSYGDEWVLVGKIYPSSFSGSKPQSTAINSCWVMVKSVRLLGTPTEPCGTPDSHPGRLESPWSISGSRANYHLA